MTLISKLKVAGIFGVPAVVGVCLYAVPAYSVPVLLILLTVPWFYTLVTLYWPQDSQSGRSVLPETNPYTECSRVVDTAIQTMLQAARANKIPAIKVEADLERAIEKSGEYVAVVSECTGE